MSIIDILSPPTHIYIIFYMHTYIYITLYHAPGKQRQCCKFPAGMVLLWNEVVPLKMNPKRQQLYWCQPSELCTFWLQSNWWLCLRWQLKCHKHLRWGLLWHLVGWIVVLWLWCSHCLHHSQQNLWNKKIRNILNF